MEAVAEKEVLVFCVSKKLSFQKCIEKKEWSNVMQRLSRREKASLSKSKKTLATTTLFKGQPTSSLEL